MSDIIATARRISMLHEDALTLLHKLAAETGGPVIEVGPYIGGSTIALASAAPVITIEVGGANPDNEWVPTNDIIGDLRRNLEQVGLSKRVTIIEGRFSQRSCIEATKAHLAGRRAGMLFVDTDPGTELCLATYLQFLREGAVIAIDDYHSEIAVEKSKLVRAFVDRAVDIGALQQNTVANWGTWFGRLVNRDKLASLPIPLPVWHESGHCWLIHVGHGELADDKTKSPLLLFENDSPLQGHSFHADIRSDGCGRYSHWGDYIYFATSDNSDPRVNGRRYSYSLEGRAIVPLNDPILL